MGSSSKAAGSALSLSLGAAGLAEGGLADLCLPPGVGGTARGLALLIALPGRALDGVGRALFRCCCEDSSDAETFHQSCTHFPQIHSENIVY